MLSAKDIAAVITAIEICNDPELKREVLCESGSDYDINGENYQYDRKKRWNEIVEKKAAVILENLGLEKQLRGKARHCTLSWDANANLDRI